MIDLSVLSEKFNIEIHNDKVYCYDDILAVLEFLKNTPEFNFDILTSIIAVDLNDKIELIWQLYSTVNNNILNVSCYTVENSAPSVISLFKSAYFDECEIYDMFGVNFSGNDKLKRLFMPESWLGHPMLKSYKMSDERLVWNE